VNPNMMDLFSEACGAAGPLLLDVIDDGETHRARRILHQPFLVCGRHEQADLRLRHGRVGVRHCYLQLVGGRVFGIDLGTRRGIRVNGVSRRCGWIERSQELMVGPVGLLLRGGDTGSAEAPHDLPSPLSARYARENPQPEATLEISTAGEEPHRWRMSRVLVLIGRSSACKLKLISPLVSEVHCALLRTPAGVWMVDLLSQTGVKVDGVRTRACLLEDGAELSIGPFTIRMRDAEQEGLERPDHRAGRRAGGRPRIRVRERWLDGDDEPEENVEVAPPLGERPAAGGSPPLSEELRQIILMARIFDASNPAPSDLAHEEREDIRRLADEIRALRFALASHRAAGDPSARRSSPPNGAGRPWTPEGGRGGMGSDLGGRPWHASEAWLDEEEAYRVEMANILKRDPRELQAIASRFLSAYNLERLSLREKIIRLLLGTPGARPMMR
jgi:pSer/pThr/pTyr-binding forkhead associated (FHA) protein